jgi:hypothetical protein
MLIRTMLWRRCFVLLTGYLLLACQSTPAKNTPPAPAAAPVRRMAQATETAKPTPSVPAKEEAKKPAEAPKPATVKEENPPLKPAAPIIIKRAFSNPYENDAFVLHMAEEHKTFGTASRVKKYKKRKFGNSLIEQRSGRRRLYDHNIFLRALFAGKLVADGSVNLKDQFEGALFFDIGSAILFGDGADTVRDIFEDKKVSPHLKIIASDINDGTNKKNRYVDIYRKSGEKLPFPVVEIPMMMEKPEHFRNPVKFFLTDEIEAVILRSANAGPDLYYDTREVQRHLRSAVAAFYGKHVIYFFNKYILYKPKERESFVILGEIDPEVGINHRVPTWEEIEWGSRTFSEAIRLNPQYAQYEK